MRRTPVTLCLVFALCGSMDLRAQPRPASASQLVDELSSIAAEWFELGLAPGLAVAAVQGDRAIYTDAFGTTDIDTGRAVATDTPFYIASTTKSFTAFLIALLDHRGEIDMDLPVNRYLPNLRLGDGLSADRITLRDLIALRHGIEDGGPIVIRTAYTGDHSPETLLELLSTYPPAEQGRAFRYGNLGYNIAGLVIDATFGEGWQELLEREVFAPAGMVATSSRISRVEPDRLAMPHRPTPDGFARVPFGKIDATMHAAGGHVSTVEDLARWVAVHLRDGRLGDRRPFPSQVVAETHRLQVEQDREFGSYHRYGWGLGWDLGTYDGDLLLHRFGSFPGYRSHVSFMPERGVGLVVLVNDGILGGVVADRLANALYDRLLEKPDAEARLKQDVAATRTMAAAGRQRLASELATRRERQAALPYPLDAYTGVFASPRWGSLVLRRADSGLEATMGAARSRVEVFDADQNQLRVELFGGGSVAEVTFEGDLAVEVSLLDSRFRRLR